MVLQEMIDKLNEDLSREYMHMHFYMMASTMVAGPFTLELKEFFEEEAADEMKHVIQFRKLIIGLGGTPVDSVAPYVTSRCPSELLKFAMEMETEVVKNYVQRQDDAESLENNPEDKEHGRWISIFLDEQILDSRKTVDLLKTMIVERKPCCNKKC